jgi:hypothetical protein
MQPNCTKLLGLARADLDLQYAQSLVQRVDSIVPTIINPRVLNVSACASRV